MLAARLVRKLCENCRQPYQPTPQLLQKLGIPPGRVAVLYREFQPPPPEQRVDEKGRPIEIEICKKCGGIGYLGRTAVFELLVVNDALREAIRRQPTPDNLRRVARANRTSRAPGRGHCVGGPGHYVPAGTAARLEILTEQSPPRFVITKWPARLWAPICQFSGWTMH